MSRSFPQRSTQVPAGRGRGQQQQTPGYQRPTYGQRTAQAQHPPPPQGQNPQAGGDIYGAVGGAEPTPAEQRIERRDAYTVIAPDQHKRHKMRSMAETEAENYQRYKEARRPGHVSYVGTAGGGSSSVRGQGAARQQQQLTRPGPTAAQRATAARARQRDHENRAEDQKKQQARTQTERNAARDADRQRSLDEDRRRKNAAFLNRLEGKK